MWPAYVIPTLPLNSQSLVKFVPIGCLLQPQQPLEQAVAQAGPAPPQHGLLGGRQLFTAVARAQVAIGDGARLGFELRAARQLAGELVRCLMWPLAHAQPARQA